MSSSPARKAYKARRAERRANDPAVQDRARRFAAERARRKREAEASEAAKQIHQDGV